MAGALMPSCGVLTRPDGGGGLGLDLDASCRAQMMILTGSGKRDGSERRLKVLQT